MVTFTGSTPVGRKVMAAAAVQGHRTQLELGGKAPFVVFDDADLDAAIQGAVAGPGAHLSQIADASIHTHLLGYWVHERQEFTLEEAVRMLTLAPAIAARSFAAAGLLREGMAADVNVFEPEPGGPGGAGSGSATCRRGGKRLSQRAEGFKATVVGGEITILDGETTGAQPGDWCMGPTARPRRSAHPEHPRRDPVVDHPRAVAPAPSRRRSACRG